MLGVIGLLLLAIVGGGFAGAASAEPCYPAAVQQTTYAEPHPERMPGRQAQVAQQLAAHRFGAIAIGDSIMGMWPTTSLDAALGVPTLNADFGSDATEEVLWRLQSMDWSQQDPRYVLVLVGTNDMRFPSCAIVEGIVAVVREVHHVFPNAEVIVTNILPRGDDLWTLDDTTSAVNARLPAQAAVERFRLFDVHDAMLCGRHTPCALFMPGNIHPSPEGFALLTELLTRLMRGH